MIIDGTRSSKIQARLLCTTISSKNICLEKLQLMNLEERVFLNLADAENLPNSGSTSIWLRI